MTIEEGASTQGPQPDEGTLETVQRNHLEQAKHFHSDLAIDPGNAEELKQSTEAFNQHNARHSDGVPNGSSSSKTPLDEAAEQFTFAVSFNKDELWDSLTWWEKLRSPWLWIANLNAPTARKDEFLVVRSFDGSGAGVLTPILIAPVDVNVIEFDIINGESVVLLSPMEKAQVRSNLDQSIACGLSVDEACQKLAHELIEASRAPLSSRTSGQRRAA